VDTTDSGGGVTWDTVNSEGGTTGDIIDTGVEPAVNQQREPAAAAVQLEEGLGMTAAQQEAATAQSVQGVERAATKQRGPEAAGPTRTRTGDGDC